MPKKAIATPQTHTLYLRRFPRDVSREIKSRAALGGMTISAFLAQFLRENLSKRSA